MIIDKAANNSLYIMIGLPGSGKDKLIKLMLSKFLLSGDAVVLSSDDIRMELFGYENQDENDKVFNEMNKRCERALMDGKNVIYNATNLNKKRRMALIQRVDKYVTNIYAVLCTAQIGTLIERNFIRPERNIPEEKLFQMFKTMDIPLKYEGYDKIFVSFSDDFDIEYGDFMSWFYNIGKDYDQMNEHHNENLLDHLETTEAKAYELSDGDRVLKIAARFHDIGKPYARTWNEEKQKYTYYNHHKISAYLYLMYTAFSMDNQNYIMYSLSPEEIETSLLIYHHMDKFVGNLDVTQDLLGTELYEKLEILMQADAYRKDNEYDKQRF